MDMAYQRLREHLDSLPGGFPPTESGVEIRILKRLFTPQEAELARQVKMKLETSATIAERVGMEEQEIAHRLSEMARKGLIFSIETPDRPAKYMAAQFIVGIWEYHVNDLDEALVNDVEAYLPTLAKEALDYLPQLRTIPVGKSIQNDLEILPYEQAEALVKNQKKFLVAPCICRREHQMKGHSCDKIMEACLVFGWAADYYERNGLGRKITLEETMEILKGAEEEGLVLQPSNSQEITNICCCCGDCCQILVNLKRHPAPAQVASSPFVVDAQREACNGCETCLDRCQMEALRLEDGSIAVHKDRCIGCGLCISTCPSQCLTLVRKPKAQQHQVPQDPKEAHLWRAKARAAAKADLVSKMKRLTDSEPPRPS